MRRIIDWLRGEPSPTIRAKCDALHQVLLPIGQQSDDRTDDNQGSSKNGGLS